MDCNLKPTKLLDCAFIGICAVIRSNTVYLKILRGKANSVDPDQTAPSGAVWSGFALFADAILLATLVYKILECLP